MLLIRQHLAHGEARRAPRRQEARHHRQHDDDAQPKQQPAGRKNVGQGGLEEHHADRVGQQRARPGKASDAPKNQLISPMITPSTITICKIAPSLAPMARITPISRVRSSTLVLIAPASPNAPTDAINTPIDSSR
jgi:hypothetical protein